MFTEAKQITDFLFAGNATVTLESTKTSSHYTFKVRKPKDKDVYFISVLTGPNNESDYTYIGIMKQGMLATTAKSKMTPDSIPVRAFNYMMTALNADMIAKDLKVMHDGNCGRCHRTLTTPESLRNGIGPECIKKVGMKG